MAEKRVDNARLRSPRRRKKAFAVHFSRRMRKNERIRGRRQRCFDKLSFARKVRRSIGISSIACESERGGTLQRRPSGKLLATKRERERERERITCFGFSLDRFASTRRHLQRFAQRNSRIVIQVRSRESRAKLRQLNPANAKCHLLLQWES